MLQLKMAKSLHGLPPSQQLDLGEILSVTIKSHEERENSTKSCAFAQNTLICRALHTYFNYLLQQQTTK